MFGVIDLSRNLLEVNFADLKQLKEKQLILWESITFMVFSHPLVVSVIMG